MVVTVAAVGWAVGRAVMADAKGVGSRAEVTVVAATAVATAVARFAYTLAPALRGARPQTSPASLSLEAEQPPGPGRDLTLQYQQKPTEEQLFIMTNEEWNQAIYIRYRYHRDTYQGHGHACSTVPALRNVKCMVYTRTEMLVKHSVRTASGTMKHLSCMRMGRIPTVFSVLYGTV